MPLPQFLDQLLQSQGGGLSSGAQPESQPEDEPLTSVGVTLDGQEHTLWLTPKEMADLSEGRPLDMPTIFHRPPPAGAPPGTPGARPPLTDEYGRIYPHHYEASGRLNPVREYAPESLTEGVR